MKKVLSLLLVVVMLCSTFAGLQITSAAEDLPSSGSCGDNVTYTFDSATGTLTISGTGAIQDDIDSSGPFYRQNAIKTLVIQSGITYIGWSSFEGCSGLTSITIPDSVTYIGWCAFGSCSGLTSVTIPDSVTSIGSYAFRGCSGLTSITIPDSVTSIGEGAFEDCSSLRELTMPCSARFDYTGGFAPFSNCTNIEKVTLTKGTGTMPNYSDSDWGDFSFRSTPWYISRESIKEIVIEDGVENIGNYAFYDCDGLTGFSIPDSVTSIGEYAFYSCESLTSITIPDTVTSIGKEAFYGCSRLTSITIPNSVTSIGEEAFSGCYSLKSVTIPDSITSIGSGTFWYCNSLTSVIIPDSVTSIGNEAFYGCGGLTSVTIGNSVTSIGNSAFYGCWSLTSITIPDSVTSLGDSVFRECGGLTNVTIPDSITSIGSYAFYYCWHLTSMTIPDTVTSIGDYAFYDCSSLTSITIPDSVTSIGNGVFFGCASLTDITIPDTVTSIGNSAFSGCSSLTSITIPDSVTSIGDSAFHSCSGLTSVTIPDFVTSIGDMVFYDCSSLTRITIPDFVTSIGSGAFYGCGRLTSVTIPDTVTSIGSSAFCGCWGLTSITIPDAVTSIGDGAFEGCGGLMNISVNSGNTKYDSRNNCNAIIETESNTLIAGCNTTIIPDSVTSISGWSFEGCHGLKSVTIPNSFTSIGPYAFFWCSGLTTIVIPDSVTSIGEEAFSDCSSLTDVYYTGTLEQWQKIDIGIFNDDLKNATIHYNYVPHEHAYTAVVTAPTCTTQGYTTHTCACGDSYSDTYVPALGHAWGEWTVTKAASCTETGVETRVCANDATHQETREIAKTDHTPAAAVKENEVAATCTVAGSYDSVVKCAGCGTELSRTAQTIPAHGHAWGEWTVTKAASCTETGVETRVCANDATHQETREIAKTDHTPAAAVKENEVAATCTVAGSYDSVVKCADCGTELSRTTQTIPELGHAWGEWTVTKAPTCTEAGEESRVCARDDAHTETRVIEARGHKFAAGEQYCQNGCGTENPDYVPPHVHEFKAVKTASTATAVGYTRYKCACGEWKKDAAGKVITDTYTAPTGKLTLKHNARTTNAIKVQWNNVKTATGYQVQISTKDGKKWSTHATLKAGVTAYTFKNLVAGNNYKFLVRFYINAPDGKNYYSPWSATLNSPTLPKSTNLALAGAKKAFTAKWTKIAGVTGYQIQYATNAKFTGAKVVNVKGAAKAAKVVKNLKGGAKYYVRIKTYKTIGGKNYFSTWSAAKAVTTKK